MNKSIWIINDYAGSPYHGMTYRHYYLARELVKKGNEVTIITAAYSHFLTRFPKTHGKYTFEDIDGIHYLWVKVFRYERSFSKKRVLKWFDFMLALFFLPQHKMVKPDVLILSPTAPFSILPAWLYAKIKKIKLLFEIRDIWPLTLVELGNYSPNHPFIKFMGLFEKFALTKSDRILSNLPNYGQHIKELGINRNFTYIPNGISIEEMEHIEPLASNVQSLIPQNKFIVGFTGKFGVANALDDLIAAAKTLKDHTNIVFILVGDGQEKEMLKLSSFGISNIIYIAPIPKKQIQSMLDFFDICYTGSKKERLYQYGVSPNKLFDYMYSGKPILHAITTPNDLVSMAKCGISVEAENPVAIANGILDLYGMTPEQRYAMGQRGKEYVITYHNYKQLASQLLALT